MKHLTATICLIFIVLLGTPASADPVDIDSDWYLIEETIQQKLIDQNLKRELFIEDSSLILKSTKETLIIYDFGEKRHDVYLVTENENSFIYVFNSEDKRLHKTKLDNINFQELDWKFNSLMSIIKTCDVEKYYLDYFLIDKVTNNSFLTKYHSSNRPDDMQCGYFIGGGRCELAIDGESGEWGGYDMMIVNNDLNYVGDLSSISSIYDRKVCEFYNKISNYKSDDKTEGAFENYHDNGQLWFKGTYKNGVRDGSWEFYHDNGQLKKKGTYKNGEWDGPFVEYEDDGRLSSKGTYKNGIRDGSWEYYKYGYLWWKGTYRNGKQDGSWESFDYGQLEWAGTYKNGKKEGSWETYRGDGQLYRKGDYKNGKKEGPWVSYHDNGQLQDKGEYKNGKAEGPYVSYDENGQLQDRGEYKNGKKEGPWVIYWNGTVSEKRTGTYKNGELVD